MAHEIDIANALNETIPPENMPNTVSNGGASNDDVPEANRPAQDYNPNTDEDNRE